MRTFKPDIYDTRTHDFLRVELRHLPLGETLNLEGANGATGLVRYHSRGTYVLFDNTVTERSCWGNLEEITEDAIYFVDNGVLRPPLSPRW